MIEKVSAQTFDEIICENKAFLKNFETGEVEEMNLIDTLTFHYNQNQTIEYISLKSDFNGGRFNQYFYENDYNDGGPSINLNNNEIYLRLNKSIEKTKIINEKTEIKINLESGDYIGDAFSTIPANEYTQLKNPIKFYFVNEGKCNIPLKTAETISASFNKKIKKDFYIKETENNNQNKKDSSSKSLLKKLLK